MTTAEGHESHEAMAKLPPILGRASNDDGSVTVEVSAGGALRSVRLTQRALSNGATYLGQTVVSVAALATARANRLAQANLIKAFGDKVTKRFDALGFEYDPALLESDDDQDNPLRWRP